MPTSSLEQRDAVRSTHKGLASSSSARAPDSGIKTEYKYALRHQWTTVGGSQQEEEEWFAEGVVDVWIGVRVGNIRVGAGVDSFSSQGADDKREVHQADAAPTRASFKEEAVGPREIILSHRKANIS